MTDYCRIKYSRAASAISVTVLLASCARPPIFAGEAACDDLLPAQIFRNVQQKYASLASYRDEGCVAVTSIDGNSIINFTTKLARPGYYRIEWARSSEATSFPSIASPEAAWSSCAYNHFLTGGKVRTEYNRDIALTHATAPSSGAAATIPQMFFKGQWGDRGEQFDDVVLCAKRQTDENVGHIDCYVFTRTSSGWTITLWIGKPDFLIHQVQTIISTGAMRAAVAGLMGDPEQMRALHGFTFTQTHTNIVLNQQFSCSDFVPSFPLFGSAYGE